MKYLLKRTEESPYIYFKNGFVDKVNTEFTKLTGYSYDELIGKSIKDIAELLKIHSQNSIENLENEVTCYMFTKECKPSEVNISCKVFNDEKKYIFKAASTSKLEGKLDFLLSVFSLNTIGVAIYDAKDRILLNTNSMFIQICERLNLKLKYQAILGKKIDEAMPAFKGCYYEEVFLDVVKNKKCFFEEEGRYIFPEDMEIYCDTTLIPIIIAGEVKYIVHTVYDITEKVLNRKLIEEQKEELEAIIENMSDDVLIIDKSGEFKHINKSFRNTKLFNNAKVLNRSDLHVNGKAFDAYGNLMTERELPTQRLLAGEKFTNMRMDYKNEYGIIYREMSGTPIYDDEGNFLAGVLVGRDISERLKKEESKMIKAQSDLLNGIIDNLGIACAMVSYPDFKFKYINNSAYGFFKDLSLEIDSMSSIIGQNMFEALDINENEIDIIKNKMKEHICQKKGIVYANRRFFLRGEEKYFKVIFQLIYDMRQEVKEIIVTATEITEEIQEKFKMERALKVQEEIFANVTHELKTPISVISSTNQLIELYLNCGMADKSREKLLNSTGVIKENCYRSIKLINNIMDMSKIDGGFFKLNLRNENIVHVVEDITQSVSDYISEKGLSLIFDTDVEEKIIACDPEKIERIILNLISNAIKFSNTNGRIFVSVKDNGDNIEISVKDNGIGIEKKNFDTIFKRFHQEDKSLSRNVEGTGIGLALAKSIVELHGGEISVESEIGQGSTFRVQLPAKTIEEEWSVSKDLPIQSKIEMIKIEFSDIYFS